MLSSDSTLVQESGNENSDVYCDQCERNFDDIALHKDLFHRERVEKWCQRCGRLFSRSSRYRDHAESNCSMNEERMCFVCAKTDFKNVKKFSAHLERHDSLNVYPCRQCSSSFTFRLNFEKHVSQSHGSHEVTFDEPLVDDVDCTSKSEKSIEVPVSSTDIDKSKTYCAPCNRDFFDIDTHRAFVHRDRPQLLCQFCGRSFFDEDLHRLHSEKHRKRRIKCFVCHLKDFERPEDLFAHLEEHESLRLFPCESCSRSFAVRHRYERHLKRKHDRSFASSTLNENTIKSFDIDQSFNKFTALRNENKSLEIGKSGFTSLTNDTHPISTERRKRLERSTCSERSTKDNDFEESLSLIDSVKAYSKGNSKEESFANVKKRKDEDNKNSESFCSSRKKKRMGKENFSSPVKFNEDCYKRELISDKFKSKTGEEVTLKQKVTDCIVIDSSSEDECSVSDLKNGKDVRLSAGRDVEGCSSWIKVETSSSLSGNSVIGSITLSDDEIPITGNSLTFDEDEASLDSIIDEKSNSVCESGGERRTVKMNASKKRLLKDGPEPKRVKRLRDSSICISDKDVDLTCFVCNTHFPKLNELYRHFIVNHNGGRIKCHTCNKSLKKPCFVYFHAMKHKGAYQWKCGTCGKSFNSWFYYKRHLFTVHEKQERYYCEICSLNFLYPTTYLAHVLQHDESSKFVCNYCSRTFIYKQHLPLHQETSTCTECDLNFPCKVLFQNHLNDVHSLDQLFSCPLCFKDFKKRRHLRFHMTVKHLNETQKELLHCQFCHYCTHNSYNLNRHCKTHH